MSRHAKDQLDLRPIMSCKSRALQGSISVPGDKSISHRALILGALSEGTTSIQGLLRSEDVLNTARALQNLGVTIEEKDGNWIVIGSGLGGLVQPETDIDFGNSGTGVRLMMGVLAGHSITATYTGDASLRKRPMGRVLDPLTKMGLAIQGESKNTLPLVLKGSDNLVPIEYTLPVASAQVKSAILIAGVSTAGLTTVIEPHKTRDHTEKMLSYFGAKLTLTEREGTTHITIDGQNSLSGRPVTVPGDPSSAAFIIAAALLCESSDVTVINVLINATRTGFYETILEMGADLTYLNQRTVNEEPVADIRVKTSKLKAVRVPAQRAPSMIDEFPCLAVLAAFAEGETVMEGLSELRVKESDRLSAIIDGLNACGVDAKAVDDNLHVHGMRQVPGGAMVKTHLDHRIAMSFLVMGLGSKQPVSVDDASMIATSFPDFEILIEKLGGIIQENKISPSSVA